MRALAVACIPQLGGRELQQWQRARHVGERVEHVFDHRRALEPVADHLDRCSERFAQAAAIGRLQEHETARQLLHEPRVLGDAIEEVRAHRHDDAQRGRCVIGDTGERRGERSALRGVGHQRVELFELVDEQQDLAVARACAST